MADPHPADKLTVRQHKALSALLTEQSVGKAAAAAAVPERTLRTWLKNPDFDGAYRAARRDAVQQATARLQSASSAAVSVLCHLMVKDTVHASIRLSAAKTILELSIKAIEIDDLAARLETLEEKYAEKSR